MSHSSAEGSPDADISAEQVHPADDNTLRSVSPDAADENRSAQKQPQTVSADSDSSLHCDRDTLSQQEQAYEDQCKSANETHANTLCSPGTILPPLLSTGDETPSVRIRSAEEERIRFYVLLCERESLNKSPRPEVAETLLVLARDYDEASEMAEKFLGPAFVAVDARTLINLEFMSLSLEFQELTEEEPIARPNL